MADPRVVRPLARTLADPRVAPAASTALALLGEVAVSPLIHELSSPEEVVQLAVVDALARVGAPALPLLVEALRTFDSRTRRGAAEALGYIGDASAVPALAKALQDVEVRCRGAAMAALVRIGPLAVEALIPVLQTGNPGGRAAAAEALGRIGDPRALDPLLAALTHANAGTRTAAAEALGNLGWIAGVALEPLRQHEQSESAPQVRNACRQAERQIRDALRGMPAELESASAPTGRGTEPEADTAPAGTGTEPEAE